MLPVPIVDASAVISAAKGETSPLPPSFLILDSLLKSAFSDGKRFLQVRKPNLKVR